MATDWIFPVAGANEYSNSYMTGSQKSHRGRNHEAIDVYAADGTPIVAPVGGTVDAASTGKIGGNYVRINGDDGVIYYFAHMQSKSHLRAGQRIGKAELLGFVGNTGSAATTKPHLHFSMRRQGSRQPVNPYNYLKTAYRLDAGPSTNYSQAMQEEQGSEPAPVRRERFTYASGAEVVDAVMGGDEQPTQPTAGNILGSTLSTVSNAIAGGQRQDYRSLGTAGVTKSDLELLVKQVGQESAVNMEGAEV